MTGKTATPGARRGAGADDPPGPPLSGSPLATSWKTGDGVLSLDEPVVMGILNLTPDSFSDGGELEELSTALARAESMVEAGAGILDVGGESTRPGAAEIPAEEEKRRILPFLREVAGRLPVPISVDTRKAEVARAALEAGAAVVNDVSGLAHDPELAGVVGRSRAGLVLMHMRGTPATMTGLARYDDLLGEIEAELREAVARAEAAGVERERIVVDPGIGFAKTPAQNLELLDRLHGLASLGLPLLVGPSRKSFIGALVDVPAAERVAGTVAACVMAYERGARVFRVHDVEPVVQGLRVAHAIRSAGAGEAPPGEPGTGPRTSPAGH